MWLDKIADGFTRNNDSQYAIAYQLERIDYLRNFQQPDTLILEVLLEAASSYYFTQEWDKARTLYIESLDMIREKKINPSAGHRFRYTLAIEIFEHFGDSDYLVLLDGINRIQEETFLDEVILRETEPEDIAKQYYFTLISSEHMRKEPLTAAKVLSRIRGFCEDDRFYMQTIEAFRRYARRLHINQYGLYASQESLNIALKIELDVTELVDKQSSFLWSLINENKNVTAVDFLAEVIRDSSLFEHMTSRTKEEFQLGLSQLLLQFGLFEESIAIINKMVFAEQYDKPLLSSLYQYIANTSEDTLKAYIRTVDEGIRSEKETSEDYGRHLSFVLSECRRRFRANRQIEQQICIIFTYLINNDMLKDNRYEYHDLNVVKLFTGWSDSRAINMCVTISTVNEHELVFEQVREKTEYGGI